MGNQSGGGQVTKPEEIANFIRSIRPKPICDHYIQQHLGLKRHQQAQHATSALEQTADFDRKTGTCSVCGELRNKVISAK
jgi:hypothetical protein